MKKQTNTKQRIFWGIVAVLGLVFVLGPFVFPKTTALEDIRYGATWSTMYAEQLGVDPTEGFEAAVTDLGIGLWRVPVYWDRVEAVRGEFNWSEVDAIVDVAEENDADVILAIGRRVPRWPECFFPDWTVGMPYDELGQAQLAFVELAVNRYKERDAVMRWQVENEPFLHAFGECPSIEREAFLKDQVDFVRGLDPTREVQTTASGELGMWWKVARLTNTIGVSVYRTTYTPWIGYTVYPITPWMYRLKAMLIPDTRVVVSELQAEPWFVDPIEEYTIDEQLALFGPADLDQHVRYAQNIAFDEVLLWGVEWWYALHVQGESRMWDAARSIQW